MRAAVAARATRISTTKAWAIVSPRGRIADKMTYETRKDAAGNMNEFDEGNGHKVRRVTIVCVLDQPR